MSYSSTNYSSFGLYKAGSSRTIAPASSSKPVLVLSYNGKSYAVPFSNKKQLAELRALASLLKSRPEAIAELLKSVRSAKALKEELADRYSLSPFCIKTFMSF